MLSLVTALLLAAVPASYSQRPKFYTTQGQVLHYTFSNDTDTTVFDSSPNNLDGTVQFKKSTALGIVGNALLLEPENEDDPWCVSVGNPPEVTIEKYTIMAWVNQADIGGVDPKRKEVLEKLDSYWLNVRHVDNKNVDGLPVVRCGSFFDVPGQANKVWYFADTPFGLEANKWYHLACTWNGKKFKIYVDTVDSGAITYERGTTIKDPPPGSKVHKNDLPLSVGCNPIGESEANWVGMLDEVRIYDWALPRRSILASYNKDLYG